MNCTGNNAAIRRLMLEMSGYWFTIECCNNKMMQDPDYWSRLDHDCGIDPLTREYVFDFKDLWKNHAPVQGEKNKTNTPGRRKTEQDYQKLATCNIVEINDENEPNPEYQNVPVMYSNIQREKNIRSQQFPNCTKPSRSYPIQLGSLWIHIRPFPKLSTNMPATVPNLVLCRSKPCWKKPVSQTQCQKYLQIIT